MLNFIKAHFSASPMFVAGERRGHYGFLRSGVRLDMGCVAHPESPQRYETERNGGVLKRGDLGLMGGDTSWQRTSREEKNAPD